MAVSERPLEVWQREMLSELRAIRVALEGQRRPSTLTKADQELLARLYPALAILFPNGELFTSRDVVVHPSPGVRLLRRGLSTKRLGRLFRRADGETVAGFQVRRVGKEINVILWRITAA